MAAHRCLMLHQPLCRCACRCVGGSPFEILGCVMLCKSCLCKPYLWFLNRFRRKGPWDSRCRGFRKIGTAVHWGWGARSKPQLEFRADNSNAWGWARLIWITTAGAPAAATQAATFDLGKQNSYSSSIPMESHAHVQHARNHTMHGGAVPRALNYSLK